MGIKIINLLLTLTIGVCSNSLLAQDKNLQAGNTNYEILKYYDKAAEYYLQHVKSKAASAETKARLADCFRYMNDMKSAAQYYADAYKMSGTIPAIHRFNHGMVLKALGRYEEARLQFAQYSQTEVKAGKYLASTCEWALANQVKEGLFKVFLENASGPTPDHSIAIFNNEKIVFVSSRNNRGDGEQNHLFATRADEKTGTLQAPEMLHNSRIPRFNDGPLAYSSDGKYVAFCKNNFHYGIRQISGTDVKLTLYLANASKDGNWKDEKPFSFNSSSYSNGWPAFSPSGQELYFASNMPGGMGGFDLYKCKKLHNGDWGKPENLGAAINTMGNEIAPCLLGKQMYFTSDWHAGFGGYDVFKAEQTQYGIWVKPENLGMPVNSGYDDYGFVGYEGGNSFYFTSNRPGGKGLEDIYRAEYKTGGAMLPTAELAPKKVGKAAVAAFPVVVKVIEEHTGKPVADATVAFSFEDGPELKELTNAQGEATVQLMDDQTYEFWASANNLANTQKRYTFDKQNPELLVLKMSKKLTTLPIKVGPDNKVTMAGQPTEEEERLAQLPKSAFLIKLGGFSNPGAVKLDGINNLGHILREEKPERKITLLYLGAFLDQTYAEQCLAKAKVYFPQAVLQTIVPANSPFKYEFLEDEKLLIKYKAPSTTDAQTPSKANAPSSATSGTSTSSSTEKKNPKLAESPDKPAEIASQNESAIANSIDRIVEKASHFLPGAESAEGIQTSSSENNVTASPSKAIEATLTASEVVAQEQNKAKSVQATSQVPTPTETPAYSSSQEAKVVMASNPTPKQQPKAEAAKESNMFAWGTDYVESIVEPGPPTYQILAGAFKNTNALPLELKSIGEIRKEDTGTGLTRVYVGNYKTFAEALASQNKVSELLKAKVIIRAFQDGSIVDVEKARKVTDL